ncbi:MAG: hypothetical protein WCA23_23270, partial [Stellaceae bacterium]
SGLDAISDLQIPFFAQGGTEGSNPAPSQGGSQANSGTANPIRFRRDDEGHRQFESGFLQARSFLELKGGFGAAVRNARYADQVR